MSTGRGPQGPQAGRAEDLRQDFRKSGYILYAAPRLLSFHPEFLEIRNIS